MNTQSCFNASSIIHFIKLPSICTIPHLPSRTTTDLWTRPCVAPSSPHRLVTRQPSPPRTAHPHSSIATVQRAPALLHGDCAPYLRTPHSLPTIPMICTATTPDVHGDQARLHGDHARFHGNHAKFARRPRPIRTATTPDFTATMPNLHGDHARFARRPRPICTAITPDRTATTLCSPAIIH